MPINRRALSSKNCKFYQLVLKILSRNEIRASIKGQASVSIVQQMMGNNLNLDVFNIIVYTKFGKILSIYSQDIELKPNYDGVNDRTTEWRTE